MTISFIENAYHVLGLNGSAGTRQILQRANEIIQRLRIDDVPEYSLDLSPAKSFRSEETVNEALRRLQAPKIRLAEYFFWYHIVDENDKRAERHLAAADYGGAAKIWGSAAATTSMAEAEARALRNLAVLRTLYLLTTTDGEAIETSLRTWHSLINNEAFWQQFMGDYKAAIDNSLSDDVLTKFRKGLTEHLSDTYAGLQEKQKAGNYLQAFQRIFSARGKKVEKEILDPIIVATQKEIDGLERIDLSASQNFNAGKAKTIKESVLAIQGHFNKLIEVGLFNDSEVKLLRDRAALALRRIVLDLHNNHSEFETAAKLLNVAAQLAGTESLKAMLSSDIAQISTNVEHEKANSLALEIPGLLGGGTIIFKGDRVIYDGKTLHYKDITEIAFHSVNTSVNFIPVSQSYSYIVATERQKISLSFGGILYIGNDKKKDVWARLAGISQHMIYPEIIKKLLFLIFQKEQTISIGGLGIDATGYFRTKFFGGVEKFGWNETVYIPKFSAGNVVVLRPKNGKSVQFTSIEMSTPNAVVLPDLFQACYNVVHSNV